MKEKGKITTVVDDQSSMSFFLVEAVIMLTHS